VLLNLISKSVSQSINQYVSIGQSVNQSINQSINPTINQSNNQSIQQSISKSFHVTGASNLPPVVVPVRNEALVGESKVSIVTDESLDLTDEVRDAGLSLVLF